MMILRTQLNDDRVTKLIVVDDLGPVEFLLVAEGAFKDVIP